VQFDHRPELGVVLPLVAVHLVHDEIVERVPRPEPRDRARLAPGLSGERVGDCGVQDESGRLEDAADRAAIVSRTLNEFERVSATSRQPESGKPDALPHGMTGWRGRIRTFDLLIQSQTPDSGLASHHVSVRDRHLCPIPG
jgi:hypothetical protein